MRDPASCFRWRMMEEHQPLAFIYAYTYVLGHPSPRINTNTHHSHVHTPTKQNSVVCYYQEKEGKRKKLWGLVSDFDFWTPSPIHLGTRETAQLLSALAALPTDLGSIPTCQLRTVCNFSFRESSVFFWARGIHVVNRHTRRQNIHT